MANAFDKRIVRIGLEFPDGVEYFENLAIRANGRMFTGELMSECTVTIDNLTKEHRNYILRRTSPLLNPRQQINMTVDIGRESYGTFRIYQGVVNLSRTTQPPDIGITLTAMTNSYAAGVIQGISFGETAFLKTICGEVAKNCGLILDFQVENDRQIYNFAHNGSAKSQVQALNETGQVIAFVDKGALIILDVNKTKKDTARILNAATGMIGIPEITYQGVIVKMMADNTVELGGKITLDSQMLDAANGDYFIRRIDFEVANRDQPFYYTLECTAQSIFVGTE